MCILDFLGVIISDNGTQFSSNTLVHLCHDLGVQTNIIYVVNPQTNGQVESTNKLIHKGIKRKLDEAEGLSDKQLQKMLWSYHTTPYSTTKETPFTMVYRENTMLPVRIDMPSW